MDDLPRITIDSLLARLPASMEPLSEEQLAAERDLAERLLRPEGGAIVYSVASCCIKRDAQAPRIGALDDERFVALDNIAEGEMVAVDLETPARAAERMTAEAARREP